MVTHPSTNRAERKLTSLIETNALPLRQTSTLMSVHTTPTRPVKMDLILDTVFTDASLHLPVNKDRLDGPRAVFTGSVNRRRCRR